MIGLASPRRRLRVAGRDLDEAVERLLMDHDLERGQDASGQKPSSASLDLRAVSDAAVDPFEIAAALEAVGVRPPFVRDRFGRDDVFDLAHEMYQRIPLRPAPVAAGPRPVSGGRRDLLRGAVFAVPGIAFTDVLRAGGTRVSWWALPFALTVGWALGQLVAMLGHTLRNRRDVAGGRLVVSLLLLAGLVCSLIGSVGIGFWLGTTPTTPLVVTLFVSFMVASGVLLLHEEEHVLAWAIVPAGLAYLLALLGGHAHHVGQIALGLELTAVAIVVLGALRHSSWRRWHRTRLVAADTGDALAHLLHGACCGGVVSAVLMLALHTVGTRAVSEPVTWPLLLTLGVMEWQLRSFRAAVHRVRHTFGSLERFASSAWRAFGRAIGSYALAIVGTSAAIAGGLALAGRSAPLRPLVVQAVLGLLLFADLVVLTCGGVRQVLRCWLAGIAAAALAALIFHLDGGRIDPETAWIGALIGTSVVCLALLTTARRVVRSPLT